MGLAPTPAPTSAVAGDESSPVSALRALAAKSSATLQGPLDTGRRFYGTAVHVKVVVKLAELSVEADGPYRRSDSVAISPEVARQLVPPLKPVSHWAVLLTK